MLCVDPAGTVNEVPGDICPAGTVPYTVAYSVQSVGPSDAWLVLLLLLVLMIRESSS